MTFKHTFKTALGGLRTNKSRSALTILGIVIGITAIILVMAMGQAAQDLILGQVESLGANTIAVIPGREPKGPSDSLQTFGDSLKERDLELLSRKENLPHAAKIAPIVFSPETGSYGNETYGLTILGATPDIVEMFDLTIADGRFFDEGEVKSRASVVVLGAKVKEELFGQEEAVGEKVRIKNKTLRVIGVIPEKGQVSFLDFDEFAVSPYTTVKDYILGIKHFNRLTVEVDEKKNVEATVRDIEETLRASHNISDPEKDDFFVETQADLLETLGTILSVLTLFLAAVAAISLLVGGVGIMNIMLVSVSERTREIGLRKAVGATDKDILAQFLFEAIILTGIGGVIGIILGAALAFIASILITQFANLNWQFSFPFLAAFIGLLVAAGVGLVFGLYPARQAAKKSPIDALRYE